MFSKCPTLVRDEDIVSPSREILEIYYISKVQSNELDQDSVMAMYQQNYVDVLCGIETNWIS